jgi:hypothetical protein
LKKSLTEIQGRFSGEEAEIRLIMSDSVLRGGQIGACPNVAHQGTILAYFVAVEQAAEAGRDERLVAEVTVKIRIVTPEGKGGSTRNLRDNTQVHWDGAFEKTVIESIKDLWRGEIADVVITY